jgi:hypothetical protein
LPLPSVEVEEATGHDPLDLTSRAVQSLARSWFAVLVVAVGIYTLARSAVAL